MAASVAALTGAGWVGVRALRALSVPAMMAARRYSVEPLQKWGSWADEVWEQFRNRCSFGVVRDTSTLDTLYPLGSRRTLAWVVKEAGRPVGWAAGLNTQIRDHKYFGNLPGWDRARLRCRAGGGWASGLVECANACARRGRRGAYKPAAPTLAQRIPSRRIFPRSVELSSRDVKAPV